MRKFICPYCGEDHIEEDMRKHFLFFHEMETSPTTFEEFTERFSILGLARIVGEDEDEL